MNERVTVYPAVMGEENSISSTTGDPLLVTSVASWQERPVVPSLLLSLAVFIFVLLGDDVLGTKGRGEGLLQ